MRRHVPILGLLLLGLLASGLAPERSTPAQAAGPAQFRAYWVDAFGPELTSEAQIDQLVANAKAANLNVIIAQIGRRGDCFCNRALMPRTQAAIAPLPFDPLDTLIAKAHAQGIEVHAWIIATAMWNSSTPPADPNHVFNTHGPNQSGDADWTMLRSDGLDRGGSDYYLDPGHPDAADYVAAMYTSVVANYPIDGIHLDRIRYPDYNLVGNVPAWGYNAVALRRFRAVTGRSDTPPANDAQWMDWRRSQITNLVRRIYLDVTALRPQLRVSAATITYGDGPLEQGGWAQSTTYRQVLQDWRGWMEEGILDLNIPMNYKRDHRATEPDNQRRMYRAWSDYAKDHQYSRQAAIGAALYLNTIAGSVAQVRVALAPSTAGNAGVGWIGYSHRIPDDQANAGTRAATISRAELTTALTQPSAYDPTMPPVFASAAPVPPMPWKATPTTAHLRGTVALGDGSRLDTQQLSIYDGANTLVRTVWSDGNGWFGAVDLLPGIYWVTAHKPGTNLYASATITLNAGDVGTVTLVLQPLNWTNHMYLPLVTQ